MTVVIIATAKDGLILGSDSQETFHTVIGPKRTGITKIIDITWPLPTAENPHADVLISLGFSGSISTINRMIEDIYSLFPNDEDRPKTASEFISSLDGIMTQYYKALNFTLPRILEINESPAPFDVETAVVGVYEREIIIGYYRPDHPLFVPLKETYEILGSGLFYGDVLMRRLYRKDFSVIEGGLIIGYVISEIARFDPNVGLPVDIRYYKFQNDGTIIRDKLDVDIERFRKKIDTKMKTTIQNAVREYVEERLNESKKKKI